MKTLGRRSHSWDVWDVLIMWVDDLVRQNIVNYSDSIPIICSKELVDGMEVSVRNIKLAMA